MTDIRLNFINRSNDADNSQIVIFQKNAADEFDHATVAWHVIKHPAHGQSYPFEFSSNFSVATADPHGNAGGQLAAAYGARYRVIDAGSLVLDGVAAEAGHFEVVSAEDANLDAKVYRNGKLLASRKLRARDEPLRYRFPPTIWIGVVHEVAEGAIMNSAIIDQINTELSLLGIGSADIIMTGGGAGKGAPPYAFELANIVPI